MNAIALLEKSSSIGIIFLFLWISFFAPFVGEPWLFKFLLLPCVLLIISLCFKRGLYKFIFSKIEIPFYIFLLTMIGGVVAVKEPAVAYRHFWAFIFPIPFLYLFAKIAFKENYGLLVIRSMCFMAALVCIYGIIEFLAKQNFIYTYFAKNIYFEVFKGRRMMSTQVQPAPLGSYLIAILPLSIALKYLERKVFLKAMSIICTVVISIGIILTFSRGVFLGFFIAMSIMVVFLIRRKKMLYILALILLAVIIIAGNSLLYYFGHSPFFRYSLEGLSAWSPYSNKIERFMAIGPILKEHPFLGVGLGHYRVLFGYYLPHLANIYYDLKIADCMYITILTETGIAGFSGFILFIYFLFKRIRIRLKILSKNEDRLFLVSFLSGFIGILCSFLTYDGLYWVAPSYLFWSYAGILSFLSSPEYLK